MCDASIDCIIADVALPALSFGSLPLRQLFASAAERRELSTIQYWQV